MLQKTRGIVLHALRYNDTTNIVDLYTEKFGRCSFLVALPRSKKSLLRSSIFQPLALIEFDADFRPHANLFRIKEAKPLPFSDMPYQPHKAAIAFFVAEFLYHAVHEAEENPPLFAYLEHSVTWLDACPGSFANFHLVFLMRFSRFLGLYPNLDHYREGDYFDLVNASFTPSQPMQHASFMSPAEASRVTKLMRMNYDTMHLFAMNRAERNRCLELMITYYRLHLPNFPALKSLPVLQELFD
jgi:DNA repair protein RecO (recombination protein O)